MGNSVDAGARKGDVLKKLSAMGMLKKASTIGDSAKYGPRNFKFSECFDPMTVQIKPLEDAQRAMQARRWVFSSQHAKLVGRVGRVVECDKRDRSILVRHDTSSNGGISGRVAEWWCAEALLRRIKAVCKSEHPLSEFSCDIREFTCDDCGGKDQLPYQGTQCYMYGCRLCDFDVCERCASRRQERILEHVEAVQRLEGATLKASLSVYYRPRCLVDASLDGRAVDTSNYAELEKTVGWLGRKLDFALHHISFDHPAAKNALQLKLTVQGALDRAQAEIEEHRVRTAADAKVAALEVELRERAEARAKAAEEADRAAKDLAHRAIVEQDLHALGANNIGCLYTPVAVRGTLMAWVCTNIGCTKLFRTGPAMQLHQQLDCPKRRVMCAAGCGVFLPHENGAAHDRVCPFIHRPAGAAMRALEGRDPSRDVDALRERLGELFEAVDVYKRGAVDLDDMLRMYRSVAGADTTPLVAQHQISRADLDGDGRLSRDEFVRFSLPAFAAVEFGAAAHLLDCFIAACTETVVTPEQRLLKQYNALKRERENAIRRVEKLFEVDPKEKQAVDKQYRDLPSYVNILRTRMDVELEDFASLHGLAVELGPDGRAAVLVAGPPGHSMLVHAPSSGATAAADDANDDNAALAAANRRGL